MSATGREGLRGALGPVKQIAAGLLDVGYVEAGPRDGPAVGTTTRSVSARGQAPALRVAIGAGTRYLRAGLCLLYGNVHITVIIGR